MEPGKTGARQDRIAPGDALESIGQMVSPENPRREARVPEVCGVEGAHPEGLSPEVPGDQALGTDGLDARDAAQLVDDVVAQRGDAPDGEP